MDVKGKPEMIRQQIADVLEQRKEQRRLVASDLAARVVRRLVMGHYTIDQNVLLVRIWFPSWAQKGFKYSEELQILTDEILQPYGWKLRLQGHSFGPLWTFFEVLVS